MRAIVTNGGNRTAEDAVDHWIGSTPRGTKRDDLFRWRLLEQQTSASGKVAFARGSALWVIGSRTLRALGLDSKGAVSMRTLAGSPGGVSQLFLWNRSGSIVGQLELSAVARVGQAGPSDGVPVSVSGPTAVTAGGAAAFEIGQPFSIGVSAGLGDDEVSEVNKFKNRSFSALVSRVGPSPMRPAFLDERKVEVSLRLRYMQGRSRFSQTLRLSADLVNGWELVLTGRGSRAVAERIA